MKLEEKFNKRSAPLVDVQQPTIHIGSNYSALGMKLVFFRQSGDSDGSTLAAHMTPGEALELAANLVNAARRMML